MDKSKIGMEIAATLYKYMDMNTKTVKEADFSKIALDVVKLFAIPDVSDTVCSCRYPMKKKNYDKCAMCGGKWTGRKQTILDIWHSVVKYFESKK